MNKELIKNEIKNIFNEDLSSLKLEGKTSSWKCNKLLFKNLKDKYPNILKSIKHLIEIAKRKNNFEECLGLFYCKCGNEKVLTSRFCNNHRCPEKNKSVRKTLDETMIKRYGTRSYNNMQKMQETCLKKYGVINPYASKDPKLNGKATKEKKYGDANYTNREKMNQTILEKYGVKDYMKTKEFRDKSKKTFQIKFGKDYFVQTKQFQAKRKNTCNKKYGADSFSKTKEFKDKCKQTWNNNLGVDHPMKSAQVLKKVKNTNLKRYGKESYSQTQEFKNKFKDKEFIKNMKNKERKTRSINGTLSKDLYANDIFYQNWLKKFTTTMTERHGKPYYTQTDEYKTKMKDETLLKNMQKKSYETKLKNGTFNTSSQEDEGYLKLLTKFPDAIRHYAVDPRYPFECDYYIPSLDLFIELNFHWTHGHEPFNKNNPDHINKVNSWAEKSQELDFKNEPKKFYSQAIYVWTQLDPEKLKTFQDNKLNYKIFYTKDEFNNWLGE